jgi:tetratricopeptide (TPR) repeat protein
VPCLCCWLNPKLAEAKEGIAKGIVLDDQGKYNESIQAYDKVIEIDPQDADVSYGKVLL